ncbi:MAG: DUF255 domain-containing protein [Nitrospirota bacterium]|nr:DUF255 domain-containing protein [Nitrospirota bacterium]
MHTLIIIAVCITFAFQNIAFASDFRFSPRTNKAHLIKWRSWNEGVLDEAKKMNRPILLSLSAVWCHWCHVMDETTYSDDKVIAVINDNFIPVRVDADRRPDLDSLYNQGGWPSTLILTPEGEIIKGGTFFSPDAMRSLLSESADAFSQKRTLQKSDSEEINSAPPATKSAAPDETDILKIIQIIKTSHDDKHGGFGSSQKFPNPDVIDFLISEYVKKRDPDVKAVITATLDNMAHGEIYDSVEGGFFRYATKPDWSEPHYEKLLGPNAGLIRNYARAYMIMRLRSYRLIMLANVNYALTTLLDRKTGVFYGSQDADEHYYRNKNRKGLKTPFIDRTIYTDSNALMITALLSVYDATGNREYLKISRKTADFIGNNLYTAENGMYHYYTDDSKQVSGLLSDNVLFGLALIDLYNATGEKKYMRQAESLAHFIIDNLYDHTSWQFKLSSETTPVSTSADSQVLDANTAIANYRAVILLSRLYFYEKNDKFKGSIDNTLSTFKRSYGRFAPSGALYGTALRWNLSEPVEITVIAEGGRIKRYLSKIHMTQVPEKVTRIYLLKQDRELISSLGYPLEEAVYLCAGKKCSPPIRFPEKIPGALKKFLGYPAE